MNPTNTGSFGAASGGISPELQAALQRRAGGSPTNAVTGSAPTFDSTTQPAQPVQGTGSPMPLPSTTGQPAAPTAPSTEPSAMGFETPEAQIIIKALEGRLKSLSKQDELKLGIGGIQGG